MHMKRQTSYQCTEEFSGYPCFGGSDVMDPYYRHSWFGQGNRGRDRQYERPGTFPRTKNDVAVDRPESRRRSPK